MKKLTSLFALLLLVFLTAGASAQTAPGYFTLFTTNVAASTTRTNWVVNGREVRIQPDKNLVWMPTIYSAAASSSNVIFGFNVSIDGQHYTTDYPIRITNALSGTNPVKTQSVITYATNANYRTIRLDYIQNIDTNAVTVTNALYGFFP